MTSQSLRSSLILLLSDSNDKNTFFFFEKLIIADVQFFLIVDLRAIERTTSLVHSYRCYRPIVVASPEILKIPVFIGIGFIAVFLTLKTLN